ncbi:MAG: ABC transporter substrate-binding protein [Chloroflexi bacterium]|nr:ABC transporter substrate-binding protein [Chloroflexota bacterium]
MLAACGGAADTAPEAAEPAAEESAAEPAAEEPAAEEPADGGFAEVAREDTAVLGWSISSPIGVTNPWAVPGYTHQEGNNFLWEPLYWFGIFSDEEIPWLAQNMEYTNDDFTQMVIELNPLAKWSDGVAVTSADVVFTFEGQMTDEKLAYHEAFVQFVDSVVAVDDLTVEVNFKIPAPRFMFEVLMLKFDTGIPIVPAHVFADVENWNEFAGDLDMPHSGPYTIVNWDNNQKIFDLREDWWAVEAGLIDTPDVKRIVMVNLGGQIGQNMDVVSQRIVNNEMDSALGMNIVLLQSITEKNPDVTTHTGHEAPFGYLDWWPNSLWVNTQLAPYDEVEVRNAMNRCLDRETINNVVYEGAEIANVYPFPLYPGLQAFVDSPEVQALIEKYEPGKFDPEESKALMESVGFEVNGDGLFERDGETVSAEIHGFEGIHNNIVPVLVEMLRDCGFDSSINFGDTAYQNMVDGAPGMYMWGHGASLKDPYAAFELYHGRFSTALNSSAGTNRWSRYSNPDYDAILDEMAPLASDDPQFHALAAQAMEIYWRDMIDIPVIQWLHHIPYNTTYWSNWPTADNIGPGVNGAFWAHTGQLVITGLESTK